MKIRAIIKALILFIMVLPAYAGAANLGELRLSLVDGDVQIKTEDTSEWVPATINLPLRDGDRIWAPDGARAELQTRNGTAVRLDEKSSLEILTVEDDSLQFYLGLGQAYLNFISKRDSVIQVDTPVSSIRVYDRTKFNVAVAQNGDTDISVFKGSLYAENRSGKTRVGSGKMLSLGDDYADLLPLGRSDEWEEWNKERDRRFEKRGYSSQYLPEELEGYSRDLDDNGRWVYTSSYGYVWTPALHISVGWSPYRHGRWVWIGGDYVWIAYEPWGWAPYHYGRWAFIVSFGWCWVPPVRGDVYWGPGYVGWVYTPTYVAWVPLAPMEVYYGYGYYGRHSVNIINVNINTVVVKEVYKNVHVNNAVTVVNNETFLRGKKADFKVRENPFLSERISAGRPRIEPERATRMPVIKEIPKAKEPPKTVRDVEVRVLKEKRRFVREPNRSVFVPEASPQTMPVKRMKAPKTGDAIRSGEAEEMPRTRRIQPSETEQPVKILPGKGKDIQQAPAEKKVVQPEEISAPQPVIRKKYRQMEQPVTEPEKQPSQDKKRTEKYRKEMRTPVSEKPSQQPDSSASSGAVRKEQGEKLKKKRTLKDVQEGKDKVEQQETEEGYQKKK